MQNIRLTTAFILLAIFPTSAQEFRKVRDGIEAAQFVRPIKVGEKEKSQATVNALRLDLTKVRLDVVHALDAAIGVETTSSIAARHGAIAAINAGFFRLDKSIFAGDAAGVLKIDNEILSEPFANRIALFISNKPNKTEIDFNHLDFNISVRFHGTLAKGELFFDVSGLNRERKDNELIIYTDYFHRTTLTDSNGVEIIVDKKFGLIKKIVNGKGSNEIPPNSYVLSASGEMRQKLLQYAGIGRTRSRQGIGFPPLVAGLSDLYFKAEDIVGGVPQLIKNGKIEITWEQEKASKSFVETYHPRTAVAKLKDGKFLMVTVDGRSETSGGMSLQELAEMLLEMGATDAMNLDGGGSTTMFLDGKVVNKPSDKDGERAVSDAILVFPRKK